MSGRQAGLVSLSHQGGYSVAKAVMLRHGKVRFLIAIAMLLMAPAARRFRYPPFLPPQAQPA
jgi:hypothetical protein